MRSLRLSNEEQNYTQPWLEQPQVQYFNATVRVMQYMSGSNVPYQQASIPHFHPVAT